MHDLLTTPGLNLTFFWIASHSHMPTFSRCMCRSHETVTPGTNDSLSLPLTADEETLRVTYGARCQFQSYMHKLHTVAGLLCIWMGGVLWSFSHWRILFGRHASSSPLGFPFIPLSGFWSFFLPLFVCRSSSPRCRSVGGFHQSKRVRHSQLVSSASGPPALSDMLITNQIGYHRLIQASSIHLCWDGLEALYCSLLLLQTMQNTQGFYFCFPEVFK